MSAISLKKIYSGKVRDLYEIDEKRMLMVASDRLSAFDVILDDPIPGKGEILTQISNFWFGKLAYIMPNHFTGDTVYDVLPQAEARALEKRAVVAKKLTPVKVEAIVRGYLAGSGWKDYRQTGTVCGIKLPEGLHEAQRQHRLPHAVKIMDPNSFLLQNHYRNDQGDDIFFFVNAHLREAVGSYIAFPKEIYKSLDPETKTETINELILETWRKISHTGPAPAIISENNRDPFFATFSSWYDELEINGHKVEPGKIGNGDGRFYHKLHSMKKKARDVNVLWDGEHITEVWDAHSSVFAAIGFYLKYHKEYNNEEEKKAYIREAQMMIGKTIHNTLYSEVQTYHIEHGVQITREQAKKVTNSYRSLSYNSIFRKDGSYKTDTQYYLIDNYFKEQFPLIRDFFLSYPRRLGLRKGEKGAPIIDVDPIGFDRLISYVSVKKTSNLQLHTLPYELKLISLGVCQELFYQYHIKSITVHDAIYMKNSDAKKKNIVNIIENIYMSILGWKEPNSIPRANALF